MWKFLGQGLDRSHSYDLCSSRINSGSFNALCQAEDSTLTSAASWAAIARFLTHCATAGTPKFVLFQSTKFVGIVFSSNRKLIILIPKAKTQLAISGAVSELQTKKGLVIVCLVIHEVCSHIFFPFEIVLRTQIWVTIHWGLSPPLPNFLSGIKCPSSGFPWFQMEFQALGNMLGIIYLSS